MKAYFSIEFQVFIKSKKNQVVLFLMLVLGCYYSLVLINQYEPIEKINVEEIKVRYEDRQKFLDTADLGEDAHYLVKFAAAVYPEWNKLDKERINGLEKSDLKAYAKATSDWYTYSDDIIFQNVSDGIRYNEGYYTFGNYFARDDGHVAYKREAAKYEVFSKSKDVLSKNALEERTALQISVRLSQSILPMILLAAFTFLIGDLVVKDKRNHSIVAGFPLTPLKRITVKLMVSFCAMVSLLIALIPGFLILGCRYGFGRLSYPVPVYQSQNGINVHFTIITLGNYLIQFLGLLLLWGLLLTIVVIIASQLFNQVFINLTLCFFLITGEYLYQARGFGSVFNVQYLPTSYIKIGEIITGYRNFYYVTSSLTVKGMFLMVVFLLVILSIVCGLLAKRRGRYI